MEKKKLFEQIQDACQSLVSESEEFVFISVNTTTRKSKCMASPIGVTFINQQLVVDSVDTSFLQLFKNLVKGHYNAEAEVIPEQDTLTTVLPNKNSNHDNNVENLDPKNGSPELSNQVEDNKMIGSEALTNQEALNKRDVGCDNKNVERRVPKKCGRPRKEDTKTQSSKITPSPKPEGAKPPKSTPVMRSRSGRRVSIPKWLQEDYGDILTKEIKSEPLDDFEDVNAQNSSVSEGRKIPHSSALEDKKVFQERDNASSLKISKNVECKKEENDSNSEDGKDSVADDENVSTSKKSVKRKNEDRDPEDASTEDEKEVKVHKLDKSGDIEGMMEEEEVDKTEDESAILNSLNDEKLSDDEMEDEVERDDDDVELCTEGDDNEGTKGKSGYWTCAICQTKCRKSFLVSRHMRRMHDLSNDDLRPCHACRTVYANEDCVCSSGKKTYNCDVCGVEFFSHKSLLTHEEVHKNDREVPCHICNKKFKSLRHVKMHVYHTHKRRNGKALTIKMDPAVCDICGKWFKFKCNALRHREIHFDEKRFQCSVCDMKFRHSSSLKRHMTSHQEKLDKMYVCEQCGRSFKLKQTLVQHHRVHLQKSFLKCEYCLKEFRTYKGKKYHILKAHPEKASLFAWKSFDCKTCGKQLSSQAEFMEHSKTHDESRLYICSVCGSRWETIAQMKAHLKSHSHVPYRYRCKVCNISFKASSKVRSHVMREGHVKKCQAKGLDLSGDCSNKDIIEVLEYDKLLGSEEELEMEQVNFDPTVDMVQDIQPEIQDIPEEIKVIHLEAADYENVATQVKILNEDGVEVLYDQINLPQDEITVGGEQVIYQVEIDGQNAIICDGLSTEGQNTIICDTLTSQAVESILKLQNQG